jgi:FkbM family methyltransferase
MLQLLKTKTKKVLSILSGRFSHLRRAVDVKKRWYGNSYGGFFVCPDYLSESSIIYSFGIGEDISFDTDIISHHGCSVFGFDPTPKAIKWIDSQKNSIPKQFTFLDYGLGDKTGPVTFYLPKNREHVSGSFVQQQNVDEKQAIEVQMKTLEDIAAQLGHKKINVIKMDIEGGEYRVLETLLKTQLPIDQILVEFHERFFENGKELTTKIVDLMRSKGFEIFAISDSFEEVSFIKKGATAG